MDEGFDGAARLVRVVGFFSAHVWDPRRHA